MTKHASEGEFAELALAVYLEELVAQRKVLFVGDPQSLAPERLAGSARSVDFVSARSRVRGTRRGGRVTARRWPGPEDAGRWDVVIVPDLGASGLVERERLSELARWLAADGVLVAGTPDPEGPARSPSAIGYEDFFDRLDAVFESVRMLGQAPFAGYSMVDFAPAGELDVTFDGSLLAGSGEAAQRYYALCGERDVVLDAYAVVQIPSNAVPSSIVPSSAVPSSTVPSSIVAVPTREADGEGRVRELTDALDAASVHAEELERELAGGKTELEHVRAEVAQAREREADASRERNRLEERVTELRAELEALNPSESFDHEYAGLESALQERGHELTELRVELERRGTLVRDLVEELREAQQRAASATAQPVATRTTLDWSPQEMHRALHTQLEEAVQRAVSAEAEKVQLAFSLDEVRSELAVIERRYTDELDDVRRVEAALRGTVRGLNARLAEVIELHQLTQARLALAEDDRAAAEARSRRWVKELAEVREQLELEITRSNMREDAEPAARSDALRAVEEAMAAREGHLLGALMRSREELADLMDRQRLARVEAEKAQQALTDLDQRLEGLRVGYEARIAELTREVDDSNDERDRAEIVIGELRSKLDAKDRNAETLDGELAGLRLRLADREEAIAALRSSAVGAIAPPDTVYELTRAREEIDVLRARVEELASARPSATVAYARDDARAGELSASLEAQYALAARLQRDLADAVERRRGCEERLEECGAKLAQMREELEGTRAVSDVREQEGRREADEMIDRLERSERERIAALQGLEEARAILEELAGGLPPTREATSTPAEDLAVVRQLRDRLSLLDAEAADREVLLRSLTAQLQERDDRIRALERLREGPPEGDVDRSLLQQKLFEMEERIARLTEELENERDARRRAEDRPT